MSILLGLIVIGLIIFIINQNKQAEKKVKEGKIIELERPSNTPKDFEEKLQKKLLSAQYYSPKNHTTSVLDNPKEMELYQVLKNIVGEQYTVTPHIPMKDLFHNHSKKEYYRRKGDEYLWGFHLDFVICSNYYLIPLMVIELDGKQHQSDEQKLRDAFKDAVLQKNNIPIIRIGVDSIDEMNLAQKIQDVFNQSAVLCKRCGSKYNIENYTFVCPNEKCRTNTGKKIHPLHYKFRYKLNYLEKNKKEVAEA
ncbi:MAG: DUF2726 domain-containing protein [Turicibacter sp.]|nr:DUF2726 domain-containing protein [Turicibacter sp.]